MLKQTIKKNIFDKHILLQIAGVSLLSLIVGGVCIWFSSQLALIGLLVIAAVFIMIKRPEIALLGILIATSSILFEEQLPIFSIGFGSLHIQDILLIMLLILIVVKLLIESEFKLAHTLLDLPILLFLGIILLSTFISVDHGLVSTEQALRGIRTISYYLVFFVVTNLIYRKSQVFLLVEGIILLATIVACAMVLQSFFGRSLLLFPGRVETLITQNIVYSGVTRVLPPGQSVVMFGFILLIVLMAFENEVPFFFSRVFQVGLTGLAVILTFNRNFWVMTLIIIALLVWLLREKYWQKLLIRSIFILLLGFFSLGLLLIKFEPQVSQFAQASLVRFVTLFQTDTRNEESLNYRSIENMYAIPQIISHPIIGRGLRVNYRPWDRRLDNNLSFQRSPDPRTYIHNGHLWVLLTSGFLGYIALVWFSATFILRGINNWRYIYNSKMKAIMLACTLTYMGVCIAAIVSPIYMQWNWIPVLGIMMGINESILRINKLKLL